jgi:hypothetical protein
VSDQTQQALRDAIAAHFNDECDGALISGFVLQIVGGSLEDYDHRQSQFLREIAEGQDYVKSLGILRYATLAQEAAMFDSADD